MREKAETELIKLIAFRNVCMFVSFEQLKQLAGQYRAYRASSEQAQLPMPFGAIVKAEEKEQE